MTPTQRRAMIKAIFHIERAKDELLSSSVAIAPQYPTFAKMISSMVAGSIESMADHLQNILDHEVGSDA